MFLELEEIYYPDSENGTTYGNYRCRCGRSIIAEHNWFKKPPITSCGCTYEIATKQIPKSERLILKFWNKVDKSPGLGPSNNCWIWSGKKQIGGYGIIFHGKAYLAHRLSYELEYGDIPFGLLVCHKCDNPPCVRPEHLFLGTSIENFRDAHKKGRISGAKRKMPDSDIKSIRHLVQSGVLSQSQAAIVYNVDQSTISKFLNGKIWKNVK